MKYFQSWQDFMRDPNNKALKESKGIHACKQKFIQEQNYQQWMDPQIIVESNSPGTSVNNNNSAAGKSTDFITGHEAEVSTLTWVSGITANYTGSGASSTSQDAALGMTHYAIAEGTDYAADHVNVRKKILLAIVTGSHMADLGPSLSTAGYDVVVTASYDGGTLGGSLDFGVAGAGLIASGTVGDDLGDNVAAQSATATVGGFTNTIAPSALITVATASGGGATFTVTNKYKGAVKVAATSGDTINAKAITTTASFAQSTEGTDTYHADPGSQTFLGYEAPYSHIPRKSETI